MALGWNVYARSLPRSYQELEPDELLRRVRSELQPGIEDLASWEHGIGGLAWIDELVSAGRALVVAEGIALASAYLLRAGDVPHLAGTTISPNDWVYVVAWDQS